METILGLRYRVQNAQEKQKYLTKVYQVKTGYYEHRKFVDFCTDPLGKMNRIFFNKRTGKTEFEPLEKRI